MSSYDENYSPALVQTLNDVRTALVAIRKRKGLRQMDVAHRMGRTQGMVARWEVETRDTLMSTVVEYARAVGATVEVVVREQ